MKLSIITVNLNNCEGLIKTIKSVISQKFVDYEFIIIDGGSTDGSIDAIYENKLKINYWISEKDSGIYNAMNKGIKRSSGDYLLFLNSGDYLYDDETLLKIDFSDVDFIYGDVIELKLNNGSNHLCVNPDIMDFEFLYKFSLSHQACFFKRDLFEKFGLYIESYKMVSDWAFIFNIIIIHNCSFRHINDVVAYFEDGGISRSLKFKTIRNTERQNFIESIFSPLVMDYLDQCISKQDYYDLISKLHGLNFLIYFNKVIRKINKYIFRKL